MRNATKFVYAFHAANHAPFVRVHPTIREDAQYTGVRHE